MDGLILTPLKEIYNPKGNILHVMKKNDDGYNNFGEAYFSFINKGEIKSWRKHSIMTLNLVVPIGIIKFVIFDESKNKFFSIELSQNNYQRLTLKSGLWIAFQGLSDLNIILNISDIKHDPKESISKQLHEIKYEW